MFEINPGLIVWSVIVFILLAIVLKRFAWKPLLASLEKREEHVRGSIERAEQAKQEAERLLEEHRKELTRAEEQARGIISEGRTLADKLKAEIVDSAHQQARKMIDQAKAEIERDKEVALTQLRSEVANLAILAAGKILEANLDEAKHRKLVDDALRQLPRN